MSPEQCNLRTRGRLSPRPGVPITELPPDVSHKVCLKCGLVYPKHRLLRYQYIPPGLHREVTRYVCPDCVSKMTAGERLRVVPSRRRKLVRGAAAITNPAAMQGRDRIRETKGSGVLKILAAHAEVLKDDPQRLSAEFITALARMPRGGADRG